MKKLDALRKAYREIASNEDYTNNCSWAIWEKHPGGNAPLKANIENVDFFQGEVNDAVLEKLNPNVFIVGINKAARSDQPKRQEIFTDFHDGSRYGKDRNLRAATQGTPWEGAFLTDADKKTIDTNSENVTITKDHKNALVQDIKQIRDCFSDVPDKTFLKPPVIIILKKALDAKEEKHLASALESVGIDRFMIVPANHYSWRGIKKIYNGVEYPNQPSAYRAMVIEDVNRKIGDNVDFQWAKFAKG